MSEIILQSILYGEPLEQNEFQEIKYHEYSKKLIVTRKIEYSSWIKDCAKQINRMEFQKEITCPVKVDCIFYCTESKSLEELYRGLLDVFCKARVCINVPQELNCSLKISPQEMSRIEFKILKIEE